MCSQNLLITSAKYLYTLLGLLAFQRRYFFRERFYHRLILALQNIYRYEVYLFSDWCPHGRNSIWFGQGKRTAGRRPYSILCCVYNWGGFSNWYSINGSLTIISTNQNPVWKYHFENPWQALSYIHDKSIVHRDLKTGLFYLFIYFVFILVLKRGYFVIKRT